MTPLEYAQRELAAGVREATGRNDGIPAHRYNFGEAKPWCASFVAWCFREAGEPLPGNRYKHPSVDYMEAMLRRAGAEVFEPRAGDLVTFRWRMGSDTGPGRHTGIIEAVDPHFITTIEGNVRNRVLRRQHQIYHRSITGFFRWPLEDAPL